MPLGVAGFRLGHRAARGAAANSMQGMCPSASILLRSDSKCVRAVLRAGPNCCAPFAYPLAPGPQVQIGTIKQRVNIFSRRRAAGGQAKHPPQPASTAAGQ
jgi:hypothetical protein